jgi:hypothetical protein
MSPCCPTTALYNGVCFLLHARSALHARTHARPREWGCGWQKRRAGGSVEESVRCDHCHSPESPLKHPCYHDAHTLRQKQGVLCCVTWRGLGFALIMNNITAANSAAVT